MNILVYMPVDDAAKARLEAAAPDAAWSYTTPDEINEAQVAAADVFIGNLPVELLPAAGNLKLLQLASAGYDKYIAAGGVPEGCILCNATGAYGQAVGEHLFAMTLAAMKHLPAYRDCQRDHEWRDLGPVTTLAGANVLVLGAGDIGTHLARLYAAMGAHVTGVRSRKAVPHEPFEAMGTIADLPRLLPAADVVASVLPSTDATRGLANAGFFAAMKPGAYFANAGRGDLVDQPALIAALESGHLAAAVLDVTAPEPLAKDDPLWDAPNVFITPHISGFFHLPATLENIVGIAAENLAHLADGEALRNRVN